MSEAASSEYPPFIDPTEEDIDGTVVGFDEGATKFGSAVIVRVQTSAGVRSLWLNRAVLRSKFSQLKPVIGERVTVVHRGMREGANASYHDFAVACPDRPPFQPNWDAMAGEADDSGDVNPFEPEEVG